MSEPLLCPKCGEHLHGTVEVKAYLVPLYNDAGQVEYDHFDGDFEDINLVSVYCECGWDGDPWEVAQSAKEAP
jgi:hypothetical protein